MMRFLGMVFVLAMLAAMPAIAQVVPFPSTLQGRIPSPLPPPAPAPTINGPLGRSTSPGVHQPARLNTFADRHTGCLNQGTGYGLHGRKLRAYTSNCTHTH
jgi:hypothetical protein